VTKATLTVVNRNDIRTPSLRSVTPEMAGPLDPVTFVFNEDVVGISSVSAPIRATYAGLAFGTSDPPPAEPGSWACQSAAGTPVDCVAGAVRSATWTPAAPLQSGRHYTVDLNPEHVLDVRDLAGNPIDPYDRFADDDYPTWQVSG
jgi:hypothetical protein